MGYGGISKFGQNKPEGLRGMSENYQDLKNAFDSIEAKDMEKEKRNSVINFYKAGVSVETISIATQLDIKAINAILADTGMLD